MSDLPPAAAIPALTASIRPRRRPPITLVVLVALLLLHLGWYLVARIGLHNARAEAIAAGLTGDPQTLIPPAGPDEDNAAWPYLSAFALLTAGDHPYVHGYSAGALPTRVKQLVSALRQPAGPQIAAVDRQAALAELDGPDFARVWTLVAEGSRRPRCRWPVDYTAGPRLGHTHILMRHQLVQVGMLRARLLADAGRSQKAADQIADLLWMRRQQIEDPFGLAMPDLDLDAGLRDLLEDGALTGSDLSRCRAAYAGVDHRAILTRTIDAETTLIGLWVYRHLESIDADQDSWLTNPENPLLGWYASWPAAPVRVADEAKYLRLMVSLLRSNQSGDPYASPGDGATRYPIAAMLLPGVRGWLPAPLRQRLADAASTALALAAGESPKPPPGIAIRDTGTAWEVVPELTDPSPGTRKNLTPWTIPRR